MPEPGWIPPNVTNTPNDCARMCFSCITGIHPLRLRFIDPHDEGIDFWQAWIDLAAEKGYKLKMLFNNEVAPAGHPLIRGPWPARDDELWMAGVMGFADPGAHHGIVMRGQQLHYDCAELPRTRRPRRILHGWKVSPLAR